MYFRRVINEFANDFFLRGCHSGARPGKPDDAAGRSAPPTGALFLDAAALRRG
jgi:hypothetical protein